MTQDAVTVAVFGMGYVGTTCAAYLAASGQRVIGVELDASKRQLLDAGQVPFFEPGLQETFERARLAGRLRVTGSGRDAVFESDVSLICVGTPTDADGRVSTDAVFAVAREIGQALAEKDGFHTVAVRSTSPPGTAQRVSQFIAEGSGRQPGGTFAVVANPEFLREGCALKDIANPPFTVVGADSRMAAHVMQRLYAAVNAPFVQMKPREAELLKYVCNAFHALKVTFANEVGELARLFGVDGQAVMQAFCRDTQLNISERYLRPGFAFGGSCLPKDVRALVAAGEDGGLTLPVIGHIMASNDEQVRRAAERIMALDHGADAPAGVTLLGLTFKAGSDDLRESPYVRLARMLADAGHTVRIVEPLYDPDRLFGANREYVQRMLPQLDDLLVADADRAVNDSRVVVVSRRDETFAAALSRRSAEQVLIDLCGDAAEAPAPAPVASHA